MDTEKVEDTSSWRTGLAIVCGTTAFAHEFGFWKPFHVALMEHVGLLDLPRLAFWPLLSATIGIILSILASELNFYGMRTIFPPGGGAGTPVGMELHKYRRIAGLLLLGSGASAAFISDPAQAVNNAPYLLAIGTMILWDHNQKIPGINFLVTDKIAF